MSSFPCFVGGIPLIQHGHAGVSLLRPGSNVVVAEAQAKGEESPVIVCLHIQQSGHITGPVWCVAQCLDRKRVLGFSQL